MPDLQVLEMDLASNIKDDAWISSARKAAIASYRKLMGSPEGRDSRAYHLELAWLLFKDGDAAQARAIYERFIKKFPREFTFYYAASKMEADLKDWKQARDWSEKALEFSYGDNQLRAMEQVLKVMQGQGEIDFALRRGKQFLETLKAPIEFVRTKRYIEKLKKTLIEIEAGKKTL
jgi:tetratricopeptide (TPR) repeat protein